MHVVTGEAAIALDGVGTDLLERVTEMRIAIRVVDCRREIESGQDVSCRYKRLTAPRRSVRLRTASTRSYRFPHPLRSRCSPARVRRDCGGRHGVRAGGGACAPTRWPVWRRWPPYSPARSTPTSMAPHARLPRAQRR